jgi:predicted nucleic acid-binding protein
VKRFLVDVNVVLDVLLERPPHAEHAAALWALIETGKAVGLLSAHAVTIVHYLVSHEHDRRRARRALDRLLSVYAVATVDEEVIRTAMRLSWSDFEDAVTAAAAAAAACDALVTRNPRDFKESPIPVVDAATAVALILSEGSTAPGR